jgi:hypothetical protein
VGGRGGSARKAAGTSDARKEARPDPVTQKRNGPKPRAARFQQAEGTSHLNRPRQQSRRGTLRGIAMGGGENSGPRSRQLEGSRPGFLIRAPQITGLHGRSGGRREPRLGELSERFGGGGSKQAQKGHSGEGGGGGGGWGWRTIR